MEVKALALLLLSVLAASAQHLSLKSALYPPLLFKPASGSSSSVDTNLSFWVHAGTVESVGNGGLVPNWLSQVQTPAALSNIYFTNLTGVFPTNYANATPSGSNAVRFFGQNYRVQVFQDSTNYFPSASNFSFYASVKTVSTANLLWMRHGGNDNGITLQMFAGSVYMDFPQNGGRLNAAAPGGFVDTWHVLEFHRQGDTGSFYIDGVLMASSTALTTTPTGDGFWQWSPNGDWNGHLREMRVYKTHVGSQAGTIRTNMMNDLGI